MATASAPGTEYRDVFEDLGQHVGKHRSATPPYETARELLRYDTPGHTHLVGVSDGAKSAVLHHLDGRYLIAVPITRDGLADGGPEIASFRHEGSLREWIERHRVSLDWLHPRYR